MICSQCNKAMVASVEDHPYTEAGLEHITLKNVDVLRCGGCGSYVVLVEDADVMHRTVGIEILSRNEALTAAEASFLRTMIERLTMTGWNYMNGEVGQA